MSLQERVVEAMNKERGERKRYRESNFYSCVGPLLCGSLPDGGVVTRLLRYTHGFLLFPGGPAPEDGGGGGGGGLKGAIRGCISCCC